MWPDSYSTSPIATSGHLIPLGHPVSGLLWHLEASTHVDEEDIHLEEAASPASRLQVKAEAPKVNQAPDPDELAARARDSVDPERLLPGEDPDSGYEEYAAHREEAEELRAAVTEGLRRREGTSLN
jgi:hypothetical protein